MQIKFQRGQALLLVILIMVVGLSIGLAVAGRSITNLRISSEEENSQRAFSAAEAGIEQALKEGCVPEGEGCRIITGSFTADNFESQYNATVTDLKDDGTGIILNGGNSVLADDGIDIWLVSHDSNNKPVYTTPWNGNLTIYWGAQGLVACDEAALEIVLIYSDTPSPNTAKSKRFAYDECSERRNLNNFSNPPDGGESFKGRDFEYKTAVININNGYIIRVIPLYKNAILGLKKSVGSDNLPSQGKIIESIGTSDPTKRKVTYYQGYPALPVEFFPNILFWPKQ